MDRFLYKLIAKKVHFEDILSMVAELPECVVVEHDAYVVHGTPAAEVMKTRWQLYEDYDFAIIHQVTGSDVGKYPYFYMLAKARHAKTFVAEWTPPACAGDGVVGSHGIRMASSPMIDYSEISGLQVVSIRPFDPEVLLISGSARSEYEARGLTGLTFSPCLDKVNPGAEVKWFLAEAMFSGAINVNWLHKENLAFCSSCGRFYGPRPGTEIREKAFLYVEETSIEHLDFQIASHTRCRFGMFENVRYKHHVIVSSRGLQWLRSQNGCSPMYRRPNIPWYVVETRPVNIWPLEH